MGLHFTYSKCQKHLYYCMALLPVWLHSLFSLSCLLIVRVRGLVVTWMCQTCSHFGICTLPVAFACTSFPCLAHSLVPSQWGSAQPPCLKLHLFHSTPDPPSTVLFFSIAFFTLQLSCITHLLYYICLPPLECRLYEDKDFGPFLFTSIFSAPVLFSSVTQSCLTLCDSMNCSTPGFPVHYQLPELTETHVHWVSDAIQSFHPLLSPSPPAISLSQHQGLFQWVSSSHQMAKVLKLQHQSFQWIFRTVFL